jgi:hypothetical protein
MIEEKAKKPTKTREKKPIGIRKTHGLGLGFCAKKGIVNRPSGLEQQENTVQ